MENTYTSAEKLLRDKMNELTENVDCLDTITARVFPTLPAGAEDDEYIITDLEVVTGRSRKGSFLKWAAIAAAIVLCIFFVPKSGAVNRFFYNMGAPSDRSFRRITSAVERMAADGDYRYIDVPLSRYAAEDILVTPLFSCPFEDTGRENVNVRIYIRQENDSVDTAEVYAVEYAVLNGFVSLSVALYEEIADLALVSAAELQCDISRYRMYKALAVAFAVVEPAHLREPDEGLGDAVLGELIICGYTERDCENAPLETEIQRRHRLL